MSEKTIRDRFNDLITFYNDDIYSVNKQKWEKFSNKYPLYGKGFNFEEIIKDNTLPFWSAIRYFVESDIPNTFFTMLWDDVYNSKARAYKWLKLSKINDLKVFMSTVSNDYFNKNFWEFFAIILACRGAQKTKDAAKEILTIYRCSTVPGIFQINCLVLNNPQVFLSPLKECVFKALEENDEVWLSVLMSCIDIWFDVDKSVFEKIDKFDNIKTEEEKLAFEEYLSGILSNKL